MNQNQIKQEIEQLKKEIRYNLRGINQSIFFIFFFACLIFSFISYFVFDYPINIYNALFFLTFGFIILFSHKKILNYFEEKRIKRMEGLK